MGGSDAEPARSPWLSSVELDEGQLAEAKGRPPSPSPSGRRGAGYEGAPSPGPPYSTRTPRPASQGPDVPGAVGVESPEGDINVSYFIYFKNIYRDDGGRMGLRQRRCFEFAIYGHILIEVNSVQQKRG